MSSAHRPTWNAAEGKGDTRHASKIYSSRDMPAQTTLKFRHDLEAGPSGESREELKARLAKAERDARNKKRKAEGLEAEESEDSGDEAPVDDDGFKRPKLPQRSSSDADAEAGPSKTSITNVDGSGDDDDDDEEEEEGEDEEDAEIEARARAILKEQGIDGDDVEEDDDEEEDDEEEDDDEDDTAQLMRELEKIKAERAAKKAEEEQREREKREEEIALGNPLLNSSKHLGGRASSPSASSMISTEASFGIKRRWDDDVIFKNQAAGEQKDKGDFVNDLQRSGFHRDFLNRYIK